MPRLPRRWEWRPTWTCFCLFVWGGGNFRNVWRWNQSPQPQISSLLWLPYRALCFNSAEVERESGRVGGAFAALWEGTAGGGGGGRGGASWGRGGVWQVMDRWRGGVYSTSIGRMGAGAESSLKVANALLFPPRNSQESYLWIKRGCETSQICTTMTKNKSTQKQTVTPKYELLL